MIARGIDPTKVILAPNGFDAIVLAPDSGYVKRPGEFAVAYVGNMGMTAGLDVILDGAKLLANDDRFTFLLIGDGAVAAHLRERVRREAIGNVQILGVLPRDKALKTVQLADACVIPLREGITDSLPTKLLDALWLGTPVVVSASGEARRVVEESGAGTAVPPGDAAALAQAVRRLADEPALAERCRAAGPPYVRKRYDRAASMARLSAQLAALAI
ncbi:MAG: glycosyltransferase family 4 protein [Candidatus Eremiobacteraeota bacterium]|nr:glycosyltransferase family 4 protein [Candidatus Eremiobacteraeota bacterium]